MEDAVEVTLVELRTLGIGPLKRLQVLARLKGESVSRLLFEEQALGLEAGEIGHSAHVSGIRNAPKDPLDGATFTDVVRKWPGIGGPLLLALALFSASATAAAPLEAVPPELADAVRLIDSSVEGSDVAEWVGKLLRSNPGGQSRQTVLDVLKDKPDGVFCFYLANVLDALKLGGGGVGGSLRDGLILRLTQLHWDRCRGPGGTAADTQYERLGNTLLKALGEERVAAAARRDLAWLAAHGRPSPQLMHTLPAGPPPKGAVPTLAITGAAAAVVFGLLVPPSEAAAWPLMLTAAGAL